MAQCRPRLTSDPGPRFERCREAALRALRHAADDWAKGDPEQPHPEEVLATILRIFEEEKFLRRPW